MKGYWLHRISHESDVSYYLLEQGYLTLGWSEFSDEAILNAARNKDNSRESFEKVYSSKRADKIRSRRDMWIFAQFKVGDIILVPLFDGEFQIVEISSDATPIRTIQDEVGNFTDKGDFEIIWKDGLLWRNSTKIDLGFAAKVKPITGRVKRREYADSLLTSRMKMRQTNGDLSDLAENIEELRKSIINNKPINFYEEALEKCAEGVLASICNTLNPDTFEMLIKKYMESLGANAIILPKNERGKEDKADADVIAIFNELNVEIQIQAKHHRGETSIGTDQILKYAEQYTDEESNLKHEDGEGCTVIPWVITSGKKFSEAEISQAEEFNKKSRYTKLRLITGIEFARMLVDAGFANLKTDLKSDKTSKGKTQK